jgi:hypothetical protein
LKREVAERKALQQEQLRAEAEAEAEAQAAKLAEEQAIMRQILCARGNSTFIQMQARMDARVAEEDRTRLEEELRMNAEQDRMAVAAGVSAAAAAAAAGAAAAADAAVTAGAAAAARVVAARGAAVAADAAVAAGAAAAAAARAAATATAERGSAVKAAADKALAQKALWTAARKAAAEAYLVAEKVASEMAEAEAAAAEASEAAEAEQAEKAAAAAAEAAVAHAAAAKAAAGEAAAEAAAEQAATEQAASEKDGDAEAAGQPQAILQAAESGVSSAAPAGPGGPGGPGPSPGRAALLRVIPAGANGWERTGNEAEYQSDMSLDAVERPESQRERRREQNRRVNEGRVCFAEAEVDRCNPKTTLGWEDLSRKLGGGVFRTRRHQAAAYAGVAAQRALRHDTAQGLRRERREQRRLESYHAADAEAEAFVRTRIARKADSMRALRGLTGRGIREAESMRATASTASGGRPCESGADPHVDRRSEVNTIGPKVGGDSMRWAAMQKWGSSSPALALPPDSFHRGHLPRPGAVPAGSRPQSADARPGLPVTLSDTWAGPDPSLAATSRPQGGAAAAFRAIGDELEPESACCLSPVIIRSQSRGQDTFRATGADEPLSPVTSRPQSR